MAVEAGFDGPVVRDLLRHQAWADAEHWRAFESFPGALDDEALFTRLHHLHMTQSAWVWVVGDRGDEFVFSNATDFVPAVTLRAFAVENHTALEALAASEASTLDRICGVPWFDNLQLSVREGLTQVAMHSHYHGVRMPPVFASLAASPLGQTLLPGSRRVALNRTGPLSGASALPRRVQDRRRRRRPNPRVLKILLQDRPDRRSVVNTSLT